MHIPLNISEPVIPALVGNKLLLPVAPPTPDSFMLFRNGLLMTRVYEDYTVDGKEVTPNPPPQPGDKFTVFYRTALDARGFPA